MKHYNDKSDLIVEVLELGDDIFIISRYVLVGNVSEWVWRVSLRISTNVSVWTAKTSGYNAFGGLKGVSGKFLVEVGRLS